MQSQDYKLIFLRNLKIVHLHMYATQLRKCLAQSRHWHTISGFRECANSNIALNIKYLILLADGIMINQNVGDLATMSTNKEDCQ